MALERMNRGYCRLSTLDYSKLEINESAKKKLSKEKYLERPFAYEFYHQLRKLMDNGEVDLGGPIIQAEVDKRYQHCFENGKVPDFIIHVPNNTDKNLAVIEFKLASNLRDIEEDFKKLVEFRQTLNYKYLIQVIIGNSYSLERARNHIKEISDNGEKIIIVEFNVENWRTREWEIEYKSNVA